MYKFYKNKKYTATHNSKIYGRGVDTVTENVNDYFFVCNQMSDLYKKIQGGCVDRPRVSKSVDGEWDSDYQEILSNGCCGVADILISNSWTGNKFFIGFNYGH